MNIDLKRLEKNLKKIKAKDIMSKFAITVNENTTVIDLAHLLMRFKISGVPVINAFSNISGVVTATDLFHNMENVITEIESIDSSLNHVDIPVSDIMTRDVFSVEEETTLFEIIKIMCSKRIHTLPVIKDGKILGIIGRRDVLNASYVTANKSDESDGS